MIAITTQQGTWFTISHIDFKALPGSISFVDTDGERQVIDLANVVSMEVSSR